MDTYKIKKDRLLETLIKNRDEHRAEFLKAQDKFRERVIEHLDKRLTQARDGKKVRLYIDLPEPVDYTDTYQAAIDGLEWDVRSEVELNEREFQHLVRNRWEWAENFRASTQSYTTGKWS